MGRESQMDPFVVPLHHPQKTPDRYQHLTDSTEGNRQREGSFDGRRKRIGKALEMEYGSLGCQRNTGLRDVPGT